jgi:ABC-type multidrug transport system fused ATPase/permease subunit
LLAAPYLDFIGSAREPSGIGGGRNSDSERECRISTHSGLTSDQNVDFNRAAGKDRAMKKQTITIAGSPGSGKSSTAKAIAAVLGFQHFSSGDFFRQLAVERGQSIEAMNISA